MIEVLSPGLFTTVQDLGRLGLGYLGVPEAGAADAFSLRVANRLVDNPDGAAALEMTGRGASLRFESDAAVALAGAMLDATLDGEPVPPYQTVTVRAGAVLECGALMRGWRGYLAIGGGGLKVEPVLGSASSDSLSGLGPPALTHGQRLETGTLSSTPGYYLRAPPSYGQPVALRVLPGPQEDWFTDEARDLIVTAAFKVLPLSDRTGVRLEGPALARARETELPSMGMVAGAVQVPPSGRPIVLLANHGATGGYPVIANVISADLSALAQLMPGAELRFSEVSRATALAALCEQEARLTRDLLAADAGLLAARALMMLAGRHASLKQAVVGDGIRRIRIRRGA